MDIMDILLLLGHLYEFSGSSCCLCLKIETIFQNLSLCISTFLSESESSDDDSVKASINKMLWREVVKKRDIQQRQLQLMMRHKMEQAAKEHKKQARNTVKRYIKQERHQIEKDKLGKQHMTQHADNSDD